MIWFHFRNLDAPPKKSFGNIFYLIWKSCVSFADLLSHLSGFNPFLARSPKARKLVMTRRWTGFDSGGIEKSCILCTVDRYIYILIWNYIIYIYGLICYDPILQIWIGYTPKKSFGNIFYLKITPPDLLSHLSGFSPSLARRRPKARKLVMTRRRTGFDSGGIENWKKLHIVYCRQVLRLQYKYDMIWYDSILEIWMHPQKNHLGISSIWKSISSFPDLLSPFVGKHFSAWSHSIHLPRGGVFGVIPFISLGGGCGGVGVIPFISLGGGCGGGTHSEAVVICSFHLHHRALYLNT